MDVSCLPLLSNTEFRRNIEGTRIHSEFRAPWKREAAIRRRRISVGREKTLSEGFSLRGTEHRVLVASRRVAPPLPIPNRAVKHTFGDDTCLHAGPGK